MIIFGYGLIVKLHTAIKTSIGLTITYTNKGVLKLKALFGKSREKIYCMMKLNVFIETAGCKGLIDGRTDGRTDRSTERTIRNFEPVRRTLIASFLG